MAEYTNKNFFTCQTIYGDEVSPVIHKGAGFFMHPWLEECHYNPTSYTYYKEISVVEVAMCKDEYFYGRGYHYFDEEITRSQASVLMELCQVGK